MMLKQSTGRGARAMTWRKNEKEYETEMVSVAVHRQYNIYSIITESKNYLFDLLVKSTRTVFPITICIA